MVQAEQVLETFGFVIRITQGLRTTYEQQSLYQQGRTTPGKIVTYAKGGESWHNYGLAVDFVPMENGKPVWDRTHPAYAKTIEIAESVELVSGSHWPEPKTDFPHLQLTGTFPEAAPDSYARFLLTKGLSAVWDEVDLQLKITSKG
jgi:hypothetical protein